MYSDFIFQNPIDLADFYGIVNNGTLSIFNEQITGIGWCTQKSAWIKTFHRPVGHEQFWSGAIYTEHMPPYGKYTER